MDRIVSRLVSRLVFLFAAFMRPFVRVTSSFYTLSSHTMFLFYILTASSADRTHEHEQATNKHALSR